ncbi:hypothetical protein [Methanoregula sp.]|jgi:hypothetical protein|uniref:hypothetical protein n=1 Tax=Methanoregula sp. TaxID=2052170 RepID=UPI003C1F03B4
MAPQPDDVETGDTKRPLLSARKVRLDIEEEIRNEERFQEDNLLRFKAGKR